jgi:hypothetical protein
MSNLNPLSGGVQVYKKMFKPELICQTFISVCPKNERELKTGVLNSRYTNQPNLLLLMQIYRLFKYPQAF